MKREQIVATVTDCSYCTSLFAGVLFCPRRSEDERLQENYDLYGTTTPEAYAGDQDDDMPATNGPKEERHHPLAVAVFRSNLWEKPAVHMASRRGGGETSLLDSGQGKELMAGVVTSTSRSAPSRTCIREAALRPPSNALQPPIAE